MSQANICDLVNDSKLNQTYHIVLYYKYLNMNDEEVTELIESQDKLCRDLNLTGRIRIAEEGINGTLGGSKKAIDEYVISMMSDNRFNDIDWKTSCDSQQPFTDLLIRRVKEIVSIELPNEKCQLIQTGTHLSPEEFHSMIDQYQNKIALIDVRNDYEYSIGHFEGALNPSTRRFGQFPEWCRENLPSIQEKEKILMYCTGGIRCEKASAYLKHLGLEQVYQLSGGIHRYLETYRDGGHFKGKNFVFDERVSMASTNPLIVGRCENCNLPYDQISGSRCITCRIHVLLCEKCQKELDKNIFCKEHKEDWKLTFEEIQEKMKSLELQLQEQSGRAKKGKRRSLRKKFKNLDEQMKTILIN